MNNLQLVESLLYFQARNSGDPELANAFAQVRHRLRAMIVVHEKLYRTTDLGRVEVVDYTRSIVRELQQTFEAQGQKIALDVSGPPIELPIETALPCGMIIAELAANSFKHAFAGAATGRLDIEFARDGAGLIFRVEDDGAGLPPGFDRDSAATFGWRLIRNLTSQVGGSVDVSGGRGTFVTVTVPLSGVGA